MDTPNSDNNPNASWLNSRGVWLTYVIIIAVGHLVLLSIPFLSTPIVWTLTVTIHNVATFIMLHMTKGAPWHTNDAGKSWALTHWEQIDDGRQFTATKKFLTIVPVVLFVLASFYTKYDFWHFLINAVTLIVCLIPKLPQLHRVRLFGLNKY